MNFKHIPGKISLFVTIIAVLTVKQGFGQDTTQPRQVVKEYLPVPFGTIAKMTIEIVDGDELNDKGHEGTFLFRVKSVDSIQLSEPVVIEIKDETGHFPADEFELYKYLYGKKTGSLSADISAKMRKKYVGKTFKVMAYETGAFGGVPDKYFDYQPVRQDYGFFFRHYLIVVADLTNKVD